MHKKNKSGKIFAYTWALPAVILFTIFLVYPVFQVFRMSVTSWGGFSPNADFIGLNNFKLLLKDMNFIKSMQNTLLYSLLNCTLTLVLALFTAYLMTNKDFKGKNLFRIIFYLPRVLSIVVISGIFSAIYNPEQGLLNSILGLFTREKVTLLWLADRYLVNYALIAILVWYAFGYYMVMIMSSMAAIPKELYEAGQLDGASEFEQFINVTLPLIWNNLRNMLTFMALGGITTSFLLVQTMTEGGPNGQSEVVLNYMYNQAYTNSSYGYAMAIGVFVFIFSIIFTGALRFAMTREVIEY